MTRWTKQYNETRKQLAREYNQASTEYWSAPFGDRQAAADKMVNAAHALATHVSCIDDPDGFAESITAMDAPQHEKVAAREAALTTEPADPVVPSMDSYTLSCEYTQSGRRAVDRVVAALVAAGFGSGAGLHLLDARAIAGALDSGLSVAMLNFAPGNGYMKVSL